MWSQLSSPCAVCLFFKLDQDLEILMSFSTNKSTGKTLLLANKFAVKCGWGTAHSAASETSKESRNRKR
jgi:hypothetical protein